MSSHQATLNGFDTESPDQPDSAPAPDIGPVPNFNREPGEERTELGVGLNELCECAHEYEPPRERGRLLEVERHEH